MTIYEFINFSNYTRKLAKIVSNFTDISDLLSDTSKNYTLFAPTDAAFKHMHRPHGNFSHKPPVKFIEKALAYHVVPGLYPVPRVILSHTIPTLLNESRLGYEAQRLRVSVGLKGVALNFYASVIPVNIKVKNGIIHGVNKILLPPPPGFVAIKMFPGEFSQLQLALITTGLEEALKDKATHTGGTMFLPPNDAFSKLGPRVNAFLFSERGKPYLKALLKYHIVANETLYSDAYYAAGATAPTDVSANGYFHVDLQTILGKPIAIDVKSWGRFVSMTLNGFTPVRVLDGVVMDGVMHVIPNVLIPPHPRKGLLAQGESMSIADFKACFDDKVQDGSDQLDL